MSLLARIAGPRVLLGVVLAAMAAIALMWWRLDSAQAQAATAQQASAQLREALSTAEASARARRDELERLQSALVKRDEAIRGAQQRANDFSASLDRLRLGSAAVRDWTDDPIPPGVLAGLRGGSSDTDKGDSANTTGGADAAVPSAKDER